MREDTISATDQLSPTDDTPIPLNEFDAWVQARYSATVSAAGVDGIEKATAAEAITGKVKKQIESGKLRLPIDVVARLVSDSIRTVDNRERQKTNARINEVADVLVGNTILTDDDPLLDAVALVAEGHRKTWRYVNADDITHMIVRKAKHAQNAATASAEFAQFAAVVLKALRTSGRDATVGDVL